MNKIVLLCFLAICITPALCDIWTNCGSASDKYQIKTVIITPDPPVKGKNLNVTFTGTLTESVSSGTATLSVVELIPGDAPGGSYSGKLTITDQNKAEIACITFAVKL